MLLIFPIVSNDFRDNKYYSIRHIERHVIKKSIWTWKSISIYLIDTSIHRLSIHRFSSESGAGNSNSAIRAVTFGVQKLYLPFLRKSAKGPRAKREHCGDAKEFDVPPPIPTLSWARSRNHPPVFGGLCRQRWGVLATVANGGVTHRRGGRVARAYGLRSDVLFRLPLVTPVMVSCHGYERIEGISEGKERQQQQKRGCESAAERVAAAEAAESARARATL